jgi:PAS domain-containing protein
METSPDPLHAASGALAPMPPGELRDDGALQARDLLAVVPPPTAPQRWQELFDVWDSRELLGRLVDGDPLSLRPRVLRMCREHALLMHADRLLMRALALCAFKGQLYTGSPPIEKWCDSVVQRAARDLLHEDLEREVGGELLLREDEVLFRLFVELFGVEPPLSRRASVRFHQAPLNARRVVWRITLEGRPIDAVAGLEGITQQEAEGHLRSVLESLILNRELDWNDLANEEDDL